MRYQSIGMSLLSVCIAMSAQTQPVQASQGLDSLLEEIVVTARKRDEGLQDTPIAISAFTSEALEYRGVSNIGDLSSYTPNLTFDNNPSFGGSSNAASVYIRGVGQKEFLPTTEPGVGIYVDGVYIARSVGAILDLVDVERVEVLRGPQGTLFGRNTIGGAISLISRKPSEEFEGNFSLKVGQDSRLDLKGSLHVPFSDSFRSSFSVASFNQDGYVTREDGLELGDDDTISTRAAFQWDASENVQVDFAVDYSRDRENGPALTLIGINQGNPIDPDTPPIATIYNVGASLRAGGPAAPCAFPGLPINLAVADCYDLRYAQGEDFNAGTAPSYSEADLFGTNLNVSWQINEALELRSITAYRDLDSEFARDGDHSPFVVSQFFDSLEQEQITQEFQLLGSHDRLNWILGAYYFEEEGNNINLLDFAISSFRSGGQFENDAIALYGQLSYDITERLSATIGLRYTEEDKSFLPDQVILSNPFAGSGNPALDAPFLQVGTRVLPFVTSTVEIQETTPMVNVSYDINDNVMVYTTYSEGFKSGGFSQRVFPPIVPPFTAPAGTAPVDLIPTFQPEFVDVYELGFKYNSDGGGLRLNGAIFRTNYEDLQVQVFTSVAPVTQNAGEASITGFELEMQYISSNGWLVDTAVGYVDAKYDEIDEATTFVGIDNEFERVPEWTLSAGVSKELAIGQHTITPRLDWSYRSEVFNDTFNTPSIAQDGYSLFNLSVAWLSIDEAHKVTGGINNLGDERYLVSGVLGDAFQSIEGLFDRGRQWFIRYSYDF